MIADVSSSHVAVESFSVKLNSFHGLCLYELPKLNCNHKISEFLHAASSKAL